MKKYILKNGKEINFELNYKSFNQIILMQKI